MKLKIDNKNDTLYFRFDESKIIESEEVKKDIIFDYNANDKLVAIEILNISDKIPADKLSSFQFETI